VHLREEVTRTASLEVSKAWEEEEEEDADQGRPRRRTRPNSARNFSPERHKARKREKEREFTKSPKIHKISQT
jgi:hypothetical protein